MKKEEITRSKLIDLYKIKNAKSLSIKQLDYKINTIVKIGLQEQYRDCMKKIFKESVKKDLT